MGINNPYTKSVPLPADLAQKISRDLAAANRPADDSDGPLEASPFGDVAFWADRARDALQRARRQRTLLAELFGGPALHELGRSLDDGQAALDALNGKVGAATRVYAEEFTGWSCSIEDLRDQVAATLGHLEEVVGVVEGRARRSGRPLPDDVADARAHAEATRRVVDGWS